MAAEESSLASPGEARLVTEAELRIIKAMLPSDRAAMARLANGRAPRDDASTHATVRTSCRVQPTAHDMFPASLLHTRR